MRYSARALIFLLMFMIAGCSEREEINLDINMKRIFDYKVHEVGAVQSDDINKWLTNARMTGEEGQYFTYQDVREDEDYTYSYVYRKGYSNYEVSFIYEPSDLTEKGKIHVTANNNNPINENIVEIRVINDLSILYILSDESLKNKLK